MMIEKLGGSIGVLYDGLKQIRDKDGESEGGVEAFTSVELQKFRRLNTKLMDYEKIMRKETEKLFSYAQTRVEDKHDIVSDFELTVDVYFYLDENDSVYIKDDFGNSDNIMTILRTWKQGTLKWDWGYGDNKCHNTIPMRQGTAMEYDKHCATFHALYDHTKLSYKEILKIGAFELDIKVHFEYS
ncbi:MAG: hypothetical protein Q9M43_04530 [Sulfurimonas sp.]|nr:hypothetical protein [Sulfurimonas sp.]